MRRAAISAGLALVLTIFMAQPLGAESHQHGRGGGRGGAASSPPAATKPILVGLLDRKGAPDPSTAGEVDGFVVNVAWADSVAFLHAQLG